LLFVAPRNLPMDVASGWRMTSCARLSRDHRAGYRTGLINVDFAHIRRLILLGGGALMAIGQVRGEGKTLQALGRRLHHPLMDTVSLANAKV
jgi:cell division GTPase FtsZ